MPQSQPASGSSRSVCRRSIGTIPDATVSADRPLSFAANAAVVPDATLDAESTSPEQGIVTLFVDGVRYRLSATAFAGSLDQLADVVREKVQQASGLQGIAADQSIATDAGVPGEQAAFVAENRTGCPGREKGPASPR